MTLPEYSYSPRQIAKERGHFPLSHRYQNQSNQSTNNRISIHSNERPITPLTGADANQSFDASGMQSILSGLHSGPSAADSSTTQPFSRVARLSTPPTQKPSRSIKKIGNTLVPPDPTQLPRYLETTVRPSTSGAITPNVTSSPISTRPSTGHGTRPNTAAISAQGADHTVTEPHMVRLTPIGKSYVSYFVKEKPFVSYVAEARISTEEERDLRAKAARADELEKDLADLKRLFLEHTEQLSDTKTKHHLGLWSRAVKSTKSDDVSGGGRDGADHKKDDDHAENKGELHEVFRENMSLRLRLLSAKALKFKHHDMSNAPPDLAQFLTKGFGKKAQMSLLEIGAVQRDLDSLHKDIAKLDVMAKCSSEAPTQPSTGGDSQSMEALMKERDELAKTLRKAMDHIQHLTSRLALSEARAISSKIAPRRRADSDDEDENEQLRNQLKLFKKENVFLKKKIEMSTVVDTNSAVSMMKKSVAEKQKISEETTAANPAPVRKVVIMPMFFRSTRPSGPETPDGSSKTNQTIGSIEASMDDDQEEGYESASDQASKLKKSNALARRHKKDWRRWQVDIEDDDDDDDEDEDREDTINGKVGRLSRNKSSKGGGKKLKGKKHRRENLNSPIDVSPLLHYLNWHHKDKRVNWDLRRTLRMAHDIIRKKAIQEETDESQGKYKQSVSVFFEDYFFRNFGHLAKYSLRCFVHSLLLHKNQGDRRAELFALVVGLHHPELYSYELSNMFMRCIRGLFPDTSAIKNLLDKYDGSTGESNCLVPRDNVWNAILGEGGKKHKQHTWKAEELVNLTSVNEFRREVVKKANDLPVVGIDSKQLTDIDDVLKLTVEFYVEGAMRMQLRLKNFFMDVMAGGETAKAVRRAAEDMLQECDDDPHAPVHSTAHMHVTWPDFLGFSKMCILIGDREPLKESELMSIFAKFQNTDLEDIVDEEIAKQNRKMRRTSQGEMAVLKLNELDGSDSSSSGGSSDEDEGNATPTNRSSAAGGGKRWRQLRSGGLTASLGVENKEKHRLRVKVTEEAKLLAAICYQNGMYLPPEAGTHANEMQTKSVNLWTVNK